MPNRDYEDSPYNRNEGRYENRDDSRGSRDWERRSEGDRGDWGRGSAGGYNAGNYGSGNYGSSNYGPGGYGSSSYNPSRDDYEYRGGSRYEGAQRFDEARSYDRNFNNERSYGSDRGFGDRGFGGDRSYGNDRNVGSRFDEERRWREQLRGGSGGGYRAEGRSTGYQPSSRGWERQNDWERGNDWGHDYRTRSPYGSPSFATGYDYSRGGEARDFRGDYRRDDRDWGDQLREAGQQVIGKVKRAFRGPKGYRRSDERIREDISDRLSQQDELDPSEIEIQVKDGEVTLTGTVRYRFEKFRAEELADDVNGVNDVHNQLRIAQPQSQVGSSQQAGTSSSTGASPNGALGSSSSQGATRNGRV